MPLHTQGSLDRNDQPDGQPPASAHSLEEQKGPGAADEDLVQQQQQLTISDSVAPEQPCEQDTSGKEGERAVGAEEGPGQEVAGAADEDLVQRQQQLKISDSITPEQPCELDTSGKECKRPVAVEEGPGHESSAQKPSSTYDRGETEDTPKEGLWDHQSQAEEVSKQVPSEESSVEERFLLMMLSYFSGDIDSSIHCQTQLVELTPDGHLKKPARLNDLGISYQNRFERSGELDDIENAIDCFNKAVLLTPIGHSGKPVCLGNLGSSYRSRFERLGEPADIEKSIEYQTQAASITPEGHTDRPGRLNNLGNSYQRRFESLGELSDIDKAINYKIQAVSLTPETHTERAAFLNNIGSCYKSRFEFLGELADINKAIDYQRQAVSLTPTGHADQGSWLNNLGISYQRRFERLGELSDINEAIQSQREAVSLTPNGHSDKATWLNNLGISYRRRFERLGELDDISNGIHSQTEAIELTPEDHAKLPSMLTNLGSSHHRRFEHLGDIKDIDKAINFESRAIALARQGHALQPTLLNNLGTSYQTRFDCLEELSDLEKAIDALNEAVSLTPNSHTAKPVILNGLGLSYLKKFAFQGDPVDSDRAITYLNEAVSLTPDGHADKPSWLLNLGTFYSQRFTRQGNLADIDKAIDCLNEVAPVIPDGHSLTPTVLSTLGTCHQGRFDRVHEPTDIDKSIDYLNKAVSLTPDDHALKPVRLFYLGNSYLSRSDILTGFDDTPAIACYEQAALSVTGSPRIRFQAASKWAQLSNSYLAHARSLELISQLVWVGIPIKQRYKLVAEIGDRAIEAAASAINVGLYGMALAWIEEGRSIVWNQILQLRTPFDDLSTVNPLLAQNIKQVASDLERASSRTPVIGSPTEYMRDLEIEAQRHRGLALEWDRLVEEIRRIPEFSGFMKPRRPAELKQAAKDGPVVVINVHSIRCDALILLPSSNDIGHVQLVTFSQEKVFDLRAQLISLLKAEGVRARGLRLHTPQSKHSHSFQRVLATIWSDVAKPVLDFLGYTRKQPVDELPHITWCTTGPLSFLPLHAAGCYDHSQSNIFDLVISSYTPTLGVLLAPNPQISDIHSGLLAIGQEHTQGFSDLVYTVAELSLIKECAKAARYLQLDDKNATVNAVLSAMEEYSCVHFACHGTQDPNDSTQSAFHLHDGALNLATITNKSFKNKGLAFLSACETATGDEKLPDEAVHLAAGMLMAGYRSVIATMWSIQDEDGPNVAQHVYAELLKGGQMSSGGVAKALHQATAHLREKVGEKSFIRWIPFVHLGL